MKKFFLLGLLSLFTITLIFTSCSEEDVILPSKENNAKYSNYAFSFNFSDFESKLKEGDSMQIEVVPEYISGRKFLPISPTTRSSASPMIGMVQDLGNKKVNFKANSGDNLVPLFFTGPRVLTICHVWKVSLKIDVSEEGLSPIGRRGEKTGWKGTLLGNTQERYQGNAGDSESPEFYTYIYKLISDVYGNNLGKDLYLPVKPEDARIYVEFK